VEPFLHRLLDGRIVLDIEGTSAIFGGTAHLRLDGELAETLASLLGALLVLIVGTIWRKRKLADAKKIVLPTDAAARIE
jgi:hypothetical protein